MAIRKIHVSNATGRDATVAFTGLKSAPGTRPGLPGQAIDFVRYLAAGEDGLHERLAAAHGEDYAQALVDGDPEVDLELVGQKLERTDRIFLSSTGDVLYAPPAMVEIVTGPDGEERERRAPVDTESNVNEERPVRWTGRKLPRAQVVRRFAMARTVQLRHVDGLTYDYLFAMAQELAGEGAMVMLGAGDKGREPLVFATNGTPYRGFLEGRVDGAKYMLLLHLSNMELKRPEQAGEAA
ncbi:MAG: hypothetical protein H6702_16200 [Myxococcales bacterium]|nr:hypothetical protein [Myxococcales bacterium]